MIIDEINITSGSSFEAPAEKKPELVLKGIGVAPGLAIGPVYLYSRDAFNIVQIQLDESEIEGEVQRFEHAVVRSEKELRKIGAVALDKLGEESASIFEAQALMLRDSAVYDAVVERIRHDRCNADFAVQNVMLKHRQLMKASDSEYLRERANDLLDVQDRIIRHLRRGKILSAIDRDTIVVAENLTAADILLFSRRDILGCVLEFGGATSHVSIMARALNVPAVVSTHGITDLVNNGDIVILDGLHGRVVINPTEETLAIFRQQQDRYRIFLEEQKHLSPLPAETVDGHRICLRANIELREELDLIKEYAAEGIGLFRTEMLYLLQGRISFTEDQQFEVYKDIVDRVRPQKTTFRVLDLGGDKVLPLAHREQNPFLGWRGIRVLLDRHELMIPQVRAILRASAFGPVRILLPMVSGLNEVQAFRMIFEQIKLELSSEGIPFDPNVPLGIMIEVPSAVLTANRFAGEVDFFSIGSNDLTQYTLAVDRGNDLVSSLFDELHPSVLALIKMTVDAGKEMGMPVGICGEVAANPLAVAILVGLGLDEFSVSPRYIPEVKRVIRAMRYSDARKMANEALLLCSAEEVSALAESWLKKNARELADLFDN